MRLAHVISTPRGIGGAERVLGELISEGAKRGHELLVLNPFAASPNEALRRVSEGAVYAPREVPGWRDVRATRMWLAERLWDFRPQIVHAHLFHALVLQASTRRTPSNVRWVLSHQHGNHLSLQGRRVATVLDRFAGKRFDRVVAISRFVADFLINSYGYPREKVELIPNGWTGAPRPGSSTSTPTVLSVGHLREEKGHMVLVESFARVLKTVPAARLVLVGNGPLEGSLKARVTFLGIADSVEFAGASDDVWSFYSRASVFALPSKHEALGIASMEAMASGLPVVASRVGGVPEVVAEGETGFLVAPGDVDQLAERIEHLLQSPAVAATMGAAGRRAADSMRMSDTVESYYSLYESLLS